MDADIPFVKVQDYNGDSSSVKNILDGIKQGKPKLSKGEQKIMGKEKDCQETNKKSLIRKSSRMIEKDGMKLTNLVIQRRTDC